MMKRKYLGLTLSIVITISLSRCETIDSPAIDTGTVIEVSYTSAKIEGKILEPGSGIFAFGHCWSTTPEPTIECITKTNFGSSKKESHFISTLEGLDPGEKYFVRAYALGRENEEVYGDHVEITTSSYDLPTLETSPVTSVTPNSAASGGKITDDGGSAIIARGICWNTSPEPTLSDNYTEDGQGVGEFHSDISGLLPYTRYFLRAYATNSMGTGYGDEWFFRSLTTSSDPVIDIDGNTYNTVVIGAQIWMAENLKVTHYSDGDPVPLVESVPAWDTMSPWVKAYCWYDNNPSLGEVFGALYSWAAAMNGQPSSDHNPSGIQGVCPSGWHLPSDEEWKQLEMHLGMSRVDADKDSEMRGTNEGAQLKEVGTSHWSSPNTGATNMSGFTALPGGCRSWDGSFETIGYFGYWWTSTCKEWDPYAWHRNVGFDHIIVWRAQMNNDVGFSVRCVKDQ
jgi:uncharacterized protein (TIGR02145 family)